MIIFEPLHVNEQELEHQRRFEEYVTYLQTQMVAGLNVPREFYKLRVTDARHETAGWNLGDHFDLGWSWDS
jgi:hypothetical protein